MIEGEWSSQYSPEERHRMRVRRIAQLERTAAKAAEAFTESRQDAEREIVTEGKGGQKVGTRETKRQHGDAALLRIIKDCVTESARLDGLYVDEGQGIGGVTVNNVALTAAPIPREEFQKLFEQAERYE